MIERPDILTIEISDSGETTAKLDYGQLTGGRQDIAYEIDWNIIRQLVKKQFAAIRHDNIEEVRKAGDDLMQHLLPKEIRAIFPQAGEALLLSTNRQAIPWELLWDGDFLGVRFAMGRQLITRDKIRKLGVRVAMGGRQFVTVDEIRKSESDPEIRQKTCLFLTNPTEDLPESRKEAKRLMEYFRNHGIACTLIAGEQITSADIYSYLRSKFDIVHYSGHIDIDEEKGAYLRLSRKGRFYLSTALTLDDFGRPFVFLNGCGVGPARGSSAKIVRPLIAAGCGPILCATMPVTDRGSRLFSEQLIANVLLGMSYGKATMEARKRFLNDPSGGTDWMRFVYYGNPLENMDAIVPVTDPAANHAAKPDVSLVVPEVGAVVSTDAEPESVKKEEEHGRQEKEDPGQQEKEQKQQKIFKSGKADEAEKPGRKKTILFKKKILFFLFPIIAVSALLFFLFTPSTRETADMFEKTVGTETDATPPETPAGNEVLPPASDTPAERTAAATPIPAPPNTTPPKEAIAAPKTATLAVKPKIVTPLITVAHVMDFYGSWKNGTGIVMEISQRELTRSLDGVTFRMNITGSEPVLNSNAATSVNYPSGIRFNGTVAEKGWWLDSPEIGATHSYLLFLHTGGKSFSHNGSSDGGNVYAK